MSDPDLELVPRPGSDAALEVEAEWECLDDIEVRSIQYADKPLWQCDAFHLLVGRKGVGKGTTLADLAARVTRGELGPKTRVVWIGSEDSKSIDVKPRVLAAGGDPTKIHTPKTWLRLPDHIAKLERAVHYFGDVGLLIIDPISNHTGGANSNNEEIRTAIAPLNLFADKHELILVGTRHLTEKEIRGDILSGILGTSAWVQTPRVVIAAVPDDEDQQVVHVQVVAGNRLPRGSSGRAYRIEGVRVDGADEEVTRAVVLGESTKNVNSLVGGDGSSPSDSARARELILDLLEAAPGMRLESDALDAQVATETGLKVKTVKNQRTSLKDKGLISMKPDKDEETGKVERWWVCRSNAPRPTSPVPDSSRKPASDGHIPSYKSRDLDQKEGNWSPDPDFGSQGTGSSVQEDSSSEFRPDPGWLRQELEAEESAA